MTPSEITIRAITRGGVLAALLTIILVACGGGAASAPVGSTPPATDPPVDLPTGAPPAPLAVDDLAANLVDLDGTTVQVTGYLRIEGDQAQLCGVLMESYPPQCGGVTLRVLGEVPAAVIDALDTARPDDQRAVWWGTVRIDGIVDAGGGSPTITIERIEIAELL